MRTAADWKTRVFSGGRIARLLGPLVIVSLVGTSMLFVGTTSASAQGTTTVSVSPANLTFPASGSGPIGLGLTSQAQTVTVTNTGTSSVQLGTGSCCSDPVISGANSADFALSTNGCTYETEIPVGGFCTFQVTFTPRSVDPEDAVVDIYDNAGNSPQTVTLAGQGIAATMSITPTDLSFPVHGTGPVGLGLTSPSQTVTVTNTGTVPVLLGYDTCCSNPVMTGANAADFTFTTDGCSWDSQIPVGGFCTFQLSFKPSLVSAEDASVDVYANTTPATDPETISVLGSGGAAKVKVNSKGLTFLDQPVGTTSPGQAVTVTNAGKFTVILGYDTCCSEPQVIGANAADFAIVDNGCTWDSQIPIKGFCTFDVTFDPSTSGPEDASIEIKDNAGAKSPQYVTLSGNPTGA
jgi:hypothetical protein